MNSLPVLISDLALLLVVAGITTLLCKKFNQPSIIGYILAGFLIGPVVEFIPTVADTESINLWGEIGVIFLMFTIGLEFSLHKLAQLGAGCIIATAIQVGGMTIVGFGVGQMLGWGTMNSIFLGGMLSVSSTMIVVKALNDLGLKDEPFTGMTIGILIVEDIVAVFMLVILSTLSVSQGISGLELVSTLSMLGFYLIVWLIAGIFIVPSLLKKTQKLMNDETLLVVSLGICFAMVWIANAIGFSTALGAFLAGSILASTVHAERIEHLVTPCKDLFGAVFFVSVGLKVVPSMLIQYAGPIIILTIVTIIGKIIFGAGMLVGGENLKTTVFGSFCLTQVGEFSFIIATLGTSLAVTSDFLYPVIVAVSVITTFTTPYLIGLAAPANEWLEKNLPAKWLASLNRYNEENAKREIGDEDWPKFLKSYFTTFFIYTVLVFGIIEIGFNFLLPFASEMLENTLWAKILSCGVIYLCIAPFLPPLMVFRKRYFTALWLKSFANHLPLLALMVLRTAVTILLVMLPLKHFFNMPLALLIVIVLPITILFSRSDWLVGKYLQIEARFLSNFNERQLQEKQSSKNHAWLDKQLSVAEFIVGANDTAAGCTLEELNWGKLMNVNVIKIIRGRKHINIPEGIETLHEKDKIFILGAAKALENFAVIAKRRSLLTATEAPLVTLHQFIENQDQYEEEQQLLCYAVRVAKDSPLSGKNIKESQIKSRWSCFLIGMERERLPIVNPSTNMVLNTDDLIWIIGSQKMGSALLKEDLIHG